MANAVYPTGKSAILKGDVDFLVDTIKVALVSTTSDPTTNYTYSAAHDFLDDIAAGAIVSAGVTIGTPAVDTVGGFSGADVVYAAVASPGDGQTGQALIIYKDTGVAATSQLIGYIDTATGLPVTPNGDDITVSWAGNVLTLA